MRHSLAVRLMLSFGLLVVAFLLIRFAIDLGAQIPLLILPFWILVGASLAVIAWNISARKAEDQTSMQNGERALFLASIPIAFIVSGLDCAGLTLAGCSPFCTFVKLVWVPLMAAVIAINFFAENPLLLRVVLIMSFVPLAPHCLCYNAANAWWIDRIGASPNCYVWGSTVSLIAIGACGGPSGQRISAVISLAIIAGGFGFFIAHHFFHFPW